MVDPEAADLAQWLGVRDCGLLKIKGGQYREK
jgi:hypothetical protein